MCAIAGLVASKVNRNYIYWVIKMLSVLKHRGYETTGVAYSDGYLVKTEKGIGSPDQYFTVPKQEEISADEPVVIIGHNRYSTTKGADSPVNAHPFWIFVPSGRAALAVNGNIPNLEEKKEAASKQGTIFYSDSDTEYMLYYIFEKAHCQLRYILQGIRAFMEDIHCSYSASLLLRDKLFLFRDPYANRPLVYGWKGGVLVYASEDFALRKIGVRRIKEIEPGTIMEIDLNFNIKVHQVFPKTFCRENRASCIFEAIYFAGPDTNLFGELNTAIFRRELGQKLFNEYQWRPEIVSPVPESGTPAAIGYHHASDCPFENLFVRNKDIRTFIGKGQKFRESLAKEKYSAIHTVLTLHNNLMIIDDSLVRCTTMKVLVKMLRRAAKKTIKIVVGIVSPPIKYPCFYGIDMPTKEELIASSKSVDEIREQVGADELKYLSLLGLKKVLVEMGLRPEEYCFACFDGKYKIPLK